MSVPAKAIQAYYEWTFKDESNKKNEFILLCVLVGLLIFTLAPASWVGLSVLFMLAPVVPILNRVLCRHPGEQLLEALTFEYLSGVNDHYVEEMRARKAPEGMIVMDAGLLWVLKESGDHLSLFMHLSNLQIKLATIENVSTVHETELPPLHPREEPSPID